MLPATRERIALLAGYRGCFLLVLAVTAWLLPEFNEALWRANFSAAFANPPELPDAAGLATRFRTWDAEHYLNIAVNGYDARSLEVAFYPLWPWLIRFADAVLPGGALFAGMLLANLCALAAVVLLYDYTCRRHGRRIAELSILLLLAYPGSMFLGFPYSEALFLLLVVAAFWLRQARAAFWSAAMLLSLAVLARPVGIVLVLPLAAWCVTACRARRSPWPLLAIAFPGVAWAGYFAYMHAVTGDAFISFRVQGMFLADAGAARLLDVPGFIERLFDVSWQHAYRTSPLDRLVFVGTLAGLALLLRYRPRDRDLQLLVLGLGLVPAVTAGFMSNLRYAALLFPVFIAFAHLLEARPRVAYWAGGVMLALQVLFVSRHMGHFWVA